MKCFTLVVAFLLSSCCQTVWLDLTRRQSAPVHAVVLPRVQPGAIPIPKLENRFLAKDDVDGATYTDQFDPRRTEHQELTDALVAIEKIWRTYGNGSEGLSMFDGARSGPHFGRLKVPCRKEEKLEVCVVVLLPTLTKLDFKPKLARVTYINELGMSTVEWHAISHCDGIMKDPDELPPYSQANPCGATPLGIRLTMTRPIKQPPNTKVHVELSAGFTLSTTALTFVHLSDTQLRDNDVKLTNPVMSAQLDRLVESFEHDEDQELYGPELAEALVATINEEVRVHEATRNAPSFMIHTGDSIDASTKRELVLFHDIMDRLVIPWFNVLGNHDILVFGNFLPAKDVDDKRCATQKSVVRPYVGKWFWLVKALAPGKLCVPEKIKGNVGPDDVFIAGADHVASRKTFIDEHARHVRAKVVPKWNSQSCDGVLKAGANDRGHGFDLSYNPKKTPSHADGRPVLPGYYAFALDLDLDAHARRGIFIVLNSEDLEPHEGGNAGRLLQPQVDWLAKALACVEERDLIFMFAHHAAGEIKLPTGKLLRDHPLMQDKRIVAFLYGHHHQHGLCRPGKCTKYWELESGSLLEHPQEGRLVRIKTIGAGIGFIETVVFTERLADETSGFAKRVAFARAGADRDHCLRNRCSGDNRVRRNDGAFTNARLFFKLP